MPSSWSGRRATRSKRPTKLFEIDRCTLVGDFGVILQSGPIINMTLTDDALELGGLLIHRTSRPERPHANSRRAIPSFEAIQAKGRRWPDEIAKVRIYSETYQMAGEIFAEEKPRLNPLPVMPYDCAVIRPVSSSKADRASSGMKSGRKLRPSVCSAAPPVTPPCPERPLCRPAGICSIRPRKR